MLVYPVRKVSDFEFFEEVLTSVGYNKQINSTDCAGDIILINIKHKKFFFGDHVFTVHGVAVYARDILYPFSPSEFHEYVPTREELLADLVFEKCIH